LELEKRLTFVARAFRDTPESLLVSWLPVFYDLLAFTRTFVVGLCKSSVKELKLKKQGYPPKIIFRRGLNILCRLVTNLERFDLVLWGKVVKLLSCS
jgi:hypothetical protein